MALIDTRRTLAALRRNRRVAHAGRLGLRDPVSDLMRVIARRVPRGVTGGSRERLRSPGWVVLALVVGALLGVELQARFDVRNLFDGASAAHASTLTLAGRVVGVAGGDTLTLYVDRKQYRIRLAEIDTPESDQPWGSHATMALAGKVYLRNVVVEVTDRDRYDRLVGTVWRGDRDINRELVSEGDAWAYRQYLHDRSLLVDEAHARDAKQGLWSLPNPIPPWHWRHAASVAPQPIR